MGLRLGVSIFDAAVTPLFDLLVDLLIELAHRARTHSCAPKYFGDVFDAGGRSLVLLRSSQLIRFSFKQTIQSLFNGASKLRLHDLEADSRRS